MRKLFYVVMFFTMLPTLVHSEVITVSSDAIVTGIIDGAKVLSGGSLKCSGISHGEIIVDKGGRLFSSGIANGGITNNGGVVDVTGVATVVFANSGTTTIHGIVHVVKGKQKEKVKYIKGAVVGGKKIN